MSEPTALLAPLKPETVEPHLWTEAGIVTDLWTILEDGEALPTRGQVILSLERWRKDRGTQAVRRLDIGIAVPVGAEFPLADDDLSGVLLVALRFPKFSDGRAYSTARRLRAVGFTGEVRATGDVLFDQIPLMQRTGFDAFEIVDAATVAALTQHNEPLQLPSYQSRRA